MCIILIYKPVTSFYKIIECVFVPVSGKYMAVGTYIIRLIPCIKCK